MPESLSSLRAKYEGYRLNFPEAVASFEKQNGNVLEKARSIEDSSEEDAEDYLSDSIDKLGQAIGSANSSRELSGCAVALAYGLQALGGRFGLQLEGPKASLTTQVAANEEAYSSLAKEILCKYGGSSLLDPTGRLALLTLSCIGSVHTRNMCAQRLKEETAQQPQKQTTPVQETFRPVQRPDNLDVSLVQTLKDE